MPKSKTKSTSANTGGLETVLAPAAALVVLSGAVGHTLIDKAKHKGDADGERQPGDRGRSDIEAKADDQRSQKGIKGKLRRLGDKVPPLGKALDVQQRFSEVRGNNLAAAITFQAFVSLLPLLLVVVAVVGFLQVRDGVDIATKIIGGLGLEGEAAAAIREAVSTAAESRKAASVVGVAGLLWSGLGLVNGLQFAYNQVWQVEERGIKDKAVGMLWLIGAAVLFVGSAAVTALLKFVPGPTKPLGFVVTFAVSFLLWMWTAKVLPNRNIGWKNLIPGALLGAVGLEVLKIVGAFYVPKVVASSSQLYGSLGIVFAVLAWLLFFGRLIVYSAVLNTVMYEKKAGTVTATVEVPAIPGALPDATRMGRIDNPNHG